MEAIQKCRCCLTKGLHKNLKSTYNWTDQKETYWDMLLECFNIELTSCQFIADVICEVCIKALRVALNFKQMVLQSEAELLRSISYTSEIPSLNHMIEVKEEPSEEGDQYNRNDDEGNRNYEMNYMDDEAVAVLNQMEVEIKEKDVEIKERLKHEYQGENKDEETRKKHPLSKRKRNCKSDSNGKKKVKANDIHTLVTRLAKSNVALSFGKMKPQQITIFNKVKLDDDNELRHNNMKYAGDRSMMPTEKTKHKENLLIILQYSNVVPFKNKTALGYVCGYCDQTYPDPANLRTHTETDHKKDRLDIRHFFDLGNCISKVDTTDLTCTLCDGKMADLTDLRTHLLKIHNVKYHMDVKDHIQQFKLQKGDVYDCALCSAKYETFKMLKQHMNKHYRNYTCEICESSFATRRSCVAHKATHADGSFKCDKCDKVFPSKAKKMYHEKTKHLGARNISNCAFCNVPFRSYYQRNQHLIKVHNSEAPYKCNICDKAYVLKSLLMCHIKKSHLMERNCQCNECGFKFFSKKALKAHMIKHSGERNFQCEVCHKSYARKYTLREHMRIHANDRRFKCNVCDMSFVQKCSLKSHLLSNHGISMAASELMKNV